MQSVVLAKLAVIALAVNGSGNTKDESRNLGEFSAVSVEQGVSATISVGPKTSVTVTTDDNLLPLIRTEVKNGRLIVGLTERHINSSQGIRVNITTPELKAVGASGGSAVTVEGTTGDSFEADGSGGSVLRINKMKADSIKVASSGGARVNLAGTGKDLRIYMSGGADVKAVDVPTASVMISGSGGAQAEVAASESLEADLSGGAKVQVKGNPAKRTVNRSGGAEVRFEPT
jgi:hypothetical protein